MTKIFRGVYTAIITPFTNDGNVDYESLKKIIEFQIEKGVAGIVPCGTTGESPTLSHDEHDKVIEFTVKEVAGRVKVIAGTGSNSTDEAIRLTRHAKDVGVDGALVVSPYYNKPTQLGLYRHFKKIADEVDVPCVIYNIEGRTGVNVETDTLVKLMSECKNIVAVKEASGNIAQIKEVISKKNEDFCVLSGDDGIALDLIEAGGDGVISVASNVIPGIMVEMINCALDQKFEKAREHETELKNFFDVEFVETNPIPIKTAVAMMGMCEEVFRLPMCEIEKEEHREQLANEMKKLNLI
jgi:4-hydroxy-tetrahydrodipicolinate synthase